MSNIEAMRRGEMNIVTHVNRLGKLIFICDDGGSVIDAFTFVAMTHEMQYTGRAAAMRLGDRLAKGNIKKISVRKLTS